MTQSEFIYELGFFQLLAWSELMSNRFIEYAPVNSCMAFIKMYGTFDIPLQGGLKCQELKSDLVLLNKGTGTVWWKGP